MGRNPLKEKSRKKALILYERAKNSYKFGKGSPKLWARWKKAEKDFLEKFKEPVLKPVRRILWHCDDDRNWGLGSWEEGGY